MTSKNQQSGTTNMMDDMTDRASSAYAQVKTSAMETGKAALDEIKTRASDVAATMKDGLEERADVAKDSLADGGKRLAESIRTAAGDPNSGSMQAKVLDLVATNVADMSDRLRGRDLQSILTDVQDFARRNPAAFVAGAAIAGFAMARFLRSSGTSTDNDFYAAGMADDFGASDDLMAGGAMGDGFTGSEMARDDDLMQDMAEGVSPIPHGGETQL